MRKEHSKQRGTRQRSAFEDRVPETAGKAGLAGAEVAVVDEEAAETAEGVRTQRPS